jgi:D-threo-aldose 1-dehydrogenase
MKKRTFKAPSGATLSMTELGFGTGPLGNLFRPHTEKEAQNTLSTAWKTGVRYYDTAPLYGLGLAETRLNHFLRGKKRKDYVLSTKVGRTLSVCPPDQRTGIGKFFDTPSRMENFNYTYDGVMRSLEDSLERLGIDYVDILYVHDIDVFTHGSEAARDAHVKTLMTSGYKALVKLRDEKVIKAFGAGINEWQVAKTLTEAGDFDIFLLAGRYTLLEQGALDHFLPLVQKRGIGIVVGGPYNSGILATGARPGATYDYQKAPKAVMDRVRRIEAVCTRHRVKIAQAALRFPMTHPSVVSVIPGGGSPKEASLNARTMSVKIPKALWKDLKAEGLVHKDAPVPR